MAFIDQIGSALGDVILKTSWGCRGLFLVASGCSLAALGLSLLLERSRITTGAPTTGFASILRSRQLRPIWLATAFLSISFTTALVFVKTYVTTSGIGSVGPFFAAHALSAIAWRLSFSWVPDRVGPKRMVGPGLTAYAIGLTIVGLSEDLTGLVVGGVFTGLGHGISYPVVLALATARAPVGDRGTVTAVFDLVLFAGAPLLGGFIGLAGYIAMSCRLRPARWLL